MMNQGQVATTRPVLIHHSSFMTHHSYRETPPMPDAIDPKWAWEPYRPAAKADWDLKKAGHLYRRAAFGATFDELQAAVAAGPEKAVTALIEGRDTAAFDKDFAPLAKNLADTNNGGPPLKAWWLARMLNSPHPLRE